MAKVGKQDDLNFPHLYSMRITITAATFEEWMPAFLEINPLYTGGSQRITLQFHQSGVGMLASSVALTKLVMEEKPDLIIQAGIAGSFDPTLALGSLVVIKDETLGDMGVEEEGKWKDLFDLKLEKSSYPPFEKRKLPNPWLPQYNLLNLPEVNAITINTISTDKERMLQLMKKYAPVTESMEGAALHYICRQNNVRFIQIRAISNYVGERNKAHWKIKESITALNHALITYVDKLYKIA